MSYDENRISDQIDGGISEREQLLNELASLKKVYNDLAESHAKQVIKISELQDINISQKKQLLHYEINVLASKDAELEKLESELLKAKELLNTCIDFVRAESLIIEIDEFLNKK